MYYDVVYSIYNQSSTQLNDPQVVNSIEVANCNDKYTDTCVYSRSQFWLFQLASINRLAKELKPQPLLELHSLVSDVSGDTCVSTDVQHPLGRRRRHVETSFVITIYLVLHCLAGCWPFNRANGKVPVLSSLPRTFRETPPVELHFTRAHELRSASFPRQPQTALVLSMCHHHHQLA